MSMLTDKRFLAVIGAAGVLAVALWFMRGDRSPAGGSAADGSAEGGGAAGGGGGADAAEAGGLAGGAGGGGGDKAWNPGGDNEPTVEDAQHWGWLEQDLDQLIDKTRPKARKRLDAEEFEKEYVKASVEYLKLDDKELAKFKRATQEGLKAIDEARTAMKEAQEASPYDEEDPDSIQGWRDIQTAFEDQQKDAADRVLEALPERPRTTLMREQAQTWLIRLDFGIQHADRAPSR